MDSLYVLIPIAILFVIIAVGIFLWAVRSDQFEDLERQGMNVLLDDDGPKAASAAKPQQPSDKPDAD
ncbi:MULTISPECIES: cbb3-type cytochrome oxidase assembly protein CcoS [Idiomarinaceae]|uniref:Cbb3-type cytochrome oxidase maturation protein n=3 Tax=Pseudidiomarina TaxID=2800384 RepID=A0A368V1R2_9GAMM|nr:MULTISPECIES: cbb3-type cytochrome oxidase assembly protein CcoS [Idiomarinaceae]MDT7524913.1 cbb3-type cytochrome oxidase assembly protein CcoS [Pseudidiomarina sp. GXY010]MDX1525103.1 cbb3-type cytochrome oxidase assembly protein CcoS [Pseudidiomarina maritima]MRJ40884.1 cbb3-type cytochrome oxidase assembly protein CcoS [Idiomarina sp. FeN1]NCU56688.1 cbb3-type cytochrome oxidase assembly protein CcoS [Idiomarina sp. FenA--70]NCU59068.1 cbb3-type cytochrome oxidase assembly protein CcoS 